MTPNITTLVLNLLISERKSQRMLFSERILNCESLADIFKSSPELKSNLIFALAACTKNPDGKAREELYRLAAFCEERMAAAHLSSAA